MTLNLAFISKRKMLSIFLLLACIFISLILDYFYNKNIETMTETDVVSKMNDIINDRSATSTQKLTALKAIVPFMDNLSDQNPYNSIFLDTSKSQNTQLEEVQKLVTNSINQRPIKK